MELRDFITYPGVCDLKDVPHWAFTDPEDKKPINLKALIETGMKIPCKWMLGEEQETLTDLTHILKSVPNLAFLLDVKKTGFVILDIEPKCPDDLKEKLLRSNWIYAEKSMSGKGLHLLFRAPANLNNFENARNKTVIRKKNGDYEILMCHWVTFTGQRVERPKELETSIEEIYADLASTTREKQIPVQNTDILIPFDKIPRAKEVIEDVIRTSRFKKTLEDFDNDESVFEFSNMLCYYKQCRFMMLTAKKYMVEQYGEDDVLSVAYYTILRVLPKRDKHRTLRNGIPYLLDSLITAATKIINEEGGKS